MWANPIWIRKIKPTLFGLLFALLLPNIAQAELVLTPEQARGYLQGMETPAVKAIRRYLDDCLSGQIGDFDYPCQPNPDALPGWSIKEQPLESVSGRFTLLLVSESDYGGEIFTLMFDTPPYLVVDVWVYYLDGSGKPDIRSFVPRSMSLEERHARAMYLGVYLTDPKFTR